MTREEDLDRLYELLQRLNRKKGGFRRLSNCNNNDSGLPRDSRGVYFFFESDETRQKSDRLRITKIGSHAVGKTESSYLWDRLIAHRGTEAGDHENGGDHRGSEFRMDVGKAIINKKNLDQPYWEERSISNVGASRPEVTEREYPVEKKVSKYIRSLPLLWVEVPGEPSHDSDRGFIERNAIRLVSNFDKKSIDPRSNSWLGKHHTRDRIKEVGMWCKKDEDVKYDYDPEFLNLLEEKIERT